jgi:hypothetical protein
VGRPKASVIGERCKAISPRTRVQVFDGPVQALDLTALADADVVALASDNIACEIAVGARCLALRQPLVIAAVHGESLSAQVRFYGNASSDSPCPACELTQNEWAQVDGETRFSCEGRFDANPVAERLTQPTRSPSFLCSLAADLALQQILRFTLKLGQDVADTMLEFSGYRNATVTSALQARSRCPAEHVTYDQRVPAGRLGDYSLRNLAGDAGVQDGDLENVSFSVGNLVFAVRAVCRRGHERAIHRFYGERQRIETCSKCDAALYAQPFFSMKRVPYRVAADAVDLPLRLICDPLPRWVVVHHAQPMLFRSLPDPSPAPPPVQKGCAS